MIIDIGSADDDGTGDVLRNAFRKLNKLQSVLSKVTDVGSATATLGNLYIVPASATGAWAGQDDDVAYYNGTSWEFYTPEEGWKFWIRDTDTMTVWDGSTWDDTAIGAGGSGGGSGTPTFYGFRATNNATQAISALTNTTIQLQTVDFDTESGFDNTTNYEFTVPSSLNGKYAIFIFGVDTSANEDGGLFLQRDTGGGYGLIANAPLANKQTIQGSYLTLLTTGDKYRLVINTVTASTIDNTSGVFLAMAVIETSLETFVYTETATSSVTADNDDFQGNKTDKLTNASAVTVTINTGLSPVGPWTLIQGGAGTISFAGTATLNFKSGHSGSNGQGSAITIVPTDTTDEYDVVGDTA